MSQKNYFEDVRPGLVIAGAVLLFGIFMGISFGIFEDNIKDFIKLSISANQANHIGDPTASDNIWRWWQRAHFHATGMGGFTTAMIAVTALSSLASRTKTLASVLIGVGGLYSTAWLILALKALKIGRDAAHHTILVEFVVYVSLGALLIGMGLLFSNIIFGLFAEKKAAVE